MTIAGLFAGLRASRRHSTPLEATPNTTRITMKPRESTRRYSSSNDLLIRRSWVRNPPGSYTYKTVRSTLAGLLAGRPAAKAARAFVPSIYDAPLGRMPRAFWCARWAL